MKFDPIPAETEIIAHQTIDAAFKVHGQLGPGLLESAYEACLAREFRNRGLHYRRQVVVPVMYDQEIVEAGFRADFIVADVVLVELKSLERLIPIFDAQVITYLKLTKTRLGILIYFNVSRFKDGVKRIVL